MLRSSGHGSFPFPVVDFSRKASNYLVHSYAGFWGEIYAVFYMFPLMLWCDFIITLNSFFFLVFFIWMDAEVVYRSLLYPRDDMIFLLSFINMSNCISYCEISLTFLEWTAFGLIFVFLNLQLSLILLVARQDLSLTWTFSAWNNMYL